MKSASPPYTAVIEWLPRINPDVLNVAIPEPFSVPVPRIVDPSSNVTVPVGVPEPGDVTVAVNVTDYPKTDGFAPEANAVEVVASMAVKSASSLSVPPR